MTAEGLRLSLPYPHGDGVSESKRVGCVQEAGGWRNLCSSFVTRRCGGGEGRAVPLGMGD